MSDALRTIQVDRFALHGATTSRCGCERSGYCACIEVEVEVEVVVVMLVVW